MRIHAQLLDEQIDPTKQRKRVYKLKAYQKESAKKDGDDKGQDLVVGQRATKHADAHETRTKHEEANIRAPDASTIKVAFR
jgi:hypothetical protein